MLTPTEADARFNVAMEVLDAEEQEAGDETTPKTKLDKVHKALGPVTDQMIDNLGKFLQYHTRETLENAPEATTPAEKQSISQMVLLDAFCIGACVGRKLAYKLDGPLPTLDEGGEKNSNQDQSE